MNFLPLLALLPLLLTSVDPVSAACTRTILRKEWRTTSTDFRKRYVKAVKTMQKLGTYSYFPKMHYDWNLRIHGNAVFLPWHRFFVAVFEKELLKRDNNLFVPYWAASFDSQAFEAAPIWGRDDASFGLSGEGPDNCVRTGPFADWRPDYPSSHCLKRTFGSETRALPSIESVNQAINSLRTFDELAEYLESDVHSYVHVGIGGDMAVMYSPNDPVFFLHHANIDRLWYNWQTLKPARIEEYAGRWAFHYLDLNRNNKVSASADYPLPGYEDTKVEQILNPDALCYTYQDLSPDGSQSTPLFVPIVKIAKEAAPDANDADLRDPSTLLVKVAKSTSSIRRPLLRLRRLEPLSDEWIRMNFLNATFVRANEKRINTLTDTLNRMRGFVSTTALWNRPDSFDKLVTLFNVTNFQAVTDATQIQVKVVDSSNPTASFGALRKKILSAVGKEIISPPVSVQKKLEKLIGKPVVS